MLTGEGPTRRLPACRAYPNPLPSERSPMNRYYKFGVGACLLVAAIGYLMYAGLQQSSTYYFTIDEFLPRKEELAGQGVRVAGRVAAGSLSKQTSAKGTEMTFAIGDFKGPDGDRRDRAGGLHRHRARHVRRGARRDHRGALRRRHAARAADHDQLPVEVRAQGRARARRPARRRRTRPADVAR